MLIATLVLAGLAALVHVYIFVLESLQWEHPDTMKTFGTTPEEAATTRLLAYNQGFYNLFLAIGTAAAIGITGPNHDAGLTLLTFTTASMVLAALVLVTSDRTKVRGAVVQGTAPALSLVALLVWVLTK